MPFSPHISWTPNCAAGGMDNEVNNNPVKEEKAEEEVEDLREELAVMRQTAAELNQYILSNVEGQSAPGSRRQSTVGPETKPGQPQSAAGSRRQSTVGVEAKPEQQQQQSAAGSRRQSTVVCPAETKADQPAASSSSSSSSRRQSTVGLETRAEQQQQSVQADNSSSSRRQSSVGLEATTTTTQGSRKSSIVVGEVAPQTQRKGSIAVGAADKQEEVNGGGGGAAESRRNSVVQVQAGSATPRRGSVQGSMTRRGSAQAPQDVEQMKELLAELEKKNLQLMEMNESLTEELFVIRQVACQMNQMILNNNNKKAGPNADSDPMNPDPNLQQDVKNSMMGKFQEVRESLRQFMEEQYVRPEAWEALERLNLHIDELERLFHSLALH